MIRIPSIDELGKRLRPGAWSERGFLGVRESLDRVRTRDAKALQALGVTPTQVSDALAAVIGDALNQRCALLRRNQREEFLRREDDWPAAIRSYPRQFPRFRRSELPDPDLGYLVRHRWQVFIKQYRGSQECPWGDREGRSPRWGSIDFVILNRRSALCLAGPGLVVHLIREHQFFEGRRSPYRVDPIRAVRVLELAGVTSRR